MLNDPLVIHLEDPPDSGRAACDGHAIDNVDPDYEPERPRTLCVGCQIRAQQHIA
jgi:hypothetical protein